MGFKTNVPTVEVTIDADGKPEGDLVHDTVNIDGAALAQSARALGGRVSAEMDATMEVVAKAREDWMGGPLTVLLKLRENFSEAELTDLFAVPDSDIKYSNNPDTFKVPKEVKGKTKMVSANFYTEFTHGSPAGENYLARIEWCQRARNPQAIKDDIPDDIRNMNPDELDTHESFCEQRLKSAEQGYRKALALHFKGLELDEYPIINWSPLWVKGKEGIEVQKVPEPMQLYIPGGEGKPAEKYKFLSIKQFLALDPKKALENGGNWLALIESGVTKKAAGSGSNSNAGDGFVIKTADKGLAFLAEFHRWSEEIGSDKGKMELAKLYKKLNENNNDEIVVAWQETLQFMQAVSEELKLAQKYIKLQTNGSDLVKDAVKAA